MSKKATDFQRKVMSIGYRGKEIFKPLNTGWIDEHVGCVREWIANIYFYKKGDTVIMIDAGYNYERLAEKMSWLDIDPASVKHILVTHQDTDHVGVLIGNDNPWGPAIGTMFLSFGNAWTFGGLLCMLPKEEQFEEFRRTLSEVEHGGAA